VRGRRERGAPLAGASLKVRRQIPQLGVQPAQRLARREERLVAGAANIQGPAALGEIPTAGVSLGGAVVPPANEVAQRLVAQIVDVPKARLESLGQDRVVLRQRAADGGR